MANVYTLANQFRRSLLAREREAVAQILAAYEQLLKRLEPEIKRLADLVGSEKLSTSQLLTLERYRMARAQIIAETNRLTRNASVIATDLQAAHATAALTEATELLRLAGSPTTSPFFRLPTRAIEAFVGMAGDGSPLLKLFETFAPTAADVVQEKLLEGIALGYNPKKTASMTRQSFGSSATRTLTIVRTETLRAYREASRTVYEENKDVVAGWQWLSARSGRTCAACLAMDGRVFKVNQPMSAHPRCRCTMIPHFKDQPARKSASDWFGEQEEGLQRATLGDKKFELYKSGKLKLADLVGMRQSRRWGNTVYERSLVELGGWV